MTATQPGLTDEQLEPTPTTPGVLTTAPGLSADAGEAAVPSPAGSAPQSSSWHARLGLDRFSGLYVWALIIAVFAVWIPDTFLTVTTLRVTADSQAITAMVALAMILPIAAGAFDLSVAQNLNFSLVLVCWLGTHTSWSPVLLGLTAVLASALVGAFNGLVVVRFRVSSFIATLATTSLLAGADTWLSGGRQITDGISPGFQAFAQTSVHGIPITVVYLAVVALMLWYLLEYTPTGRRLFAVGGNTETARLSGLRVDRLIFGSLVCSGAIAGFAGVVLAATVGVSSNTVGPPYLLPAFAAVFLGATQIKNGRVNVIGTLIATYLIATGVKGLQLAQVGTWSSDVFNGLALLIAVTLAVRRTSSLKSGKVARSRSG